MRDHLMPVTYEHRYIPVTDYCRDVLNLNLDTTPYFNSGVLVIDLKAWRALDISARCLEFCRAHPTLGMADQDAANHVLAGNFAPLDTRWNAMSYLLREYFPPSGSARPSIFGGYEENFRTPTGFWLEVLMQWAYDPWIVHFAYQSKPWQPTDRQTPWTLAWKTMAGEVSKKGGGFAPRPHQGRALHVDQ
jgi:lipopolysaccharide biosynthesis glycosyltransferase